MRAEVIRLACERPVDSEVPLACWSSSELAAEVISRGICEQISGVTVWRWLSEDAIRPWQYRSWIFPRGPEFTANAGRVLDLYAGRWEGELLHARRRGVRHHQHQQPPTRSGARSGRASSSQRRNS